MVPASASLDELQGQIEVRFGDESLLRLALTHSSFANEHADAPGSNERLEFLGDAVLDLVVAERLYADFPDIEEGQLTQWRAHLVQGPTIARVAARLGLGRWLLLGRGEQASGGREREGNLAHVYEALIGAIRLDPGPDGGMDGARRFIERSLEPEITGLQTDPAELDPKGALQQLAETDLGRPQYVTTDERGPDHEREFTVEVRLEGEVFGTGCGGSKQQAEKQAAREAVRRLRERLEADAPAVDVTSGAE